MLKETIKIGNRSYIKAKVVMLPTNKKAENENNNTIYLNHYSKELILNWRKARSTNQTIQHLYITSDEEIKRDFKGFAIVTVKDDTRIQYLVEIIVTEQNQCYCKGDRKFTFDYYSIKPIIATTDKLSSEPYQVHFEGIDCTNYLPQPSQSFIQKYIEEYNKGNIITDVLVECETKLEWTYSHSGRKIQEEGKPFLKVDKNNYITITKVKDSWSRDEVIELLLQFNDDKPGIFNCTKWIDENL